jgi:hypothetical protein
MTASANARRRWSPTGIALAGFGAGLMIGAVMLGPWPTGMSIEELFDASVPQRLFAAAVGLVMLVVGWILCGSNERR